MPQESQYIPGVCNINQTEIAYRRKAMYAGYGIAVGVFVAALLFHIHPWLRAVLLFVPLFIGVIGTLQVRNKFCVSYGAAGKQNAVEGDDTASYVEKQEFIDADKRKARTMNLQALCTTAAVILMTTFIPQP